MEHSGSAWDNAKKYILAVRAPKPTRLQLSADTVGDPFKDTSGPRLNILIKLMTMVAIATVGVTLSYSLF